jgi:hypothetical protein
MKRKRTSHAGGFRKKAHIIDQSASATPPAIEQPVLQRYYPRLLTLRHYLLSQLPKSSKNRRRNISQLGRPTATRSATRNATQNKTQNESQNESQNTTSKGVSDIELGQLLDSTVIGGGSNTAQTYNQDQIVTERNKDIETFTQQLSSTTAGGTFTPGYFLQSEVGHIMQRCHRMISLAA